MVDLHVHTDRSDGTLSPRGVVELASKQGITHLAITDHDTFAGNAEAIGAGRELGVEVIGGVELSVRYETVSFHLLGYGIDFITDRVCRVFKFLKKSRADRLPKMVERLREARVDITAELLAPLAPGGLVGRAHVARWLVKNGYVADMRTAFARYLGKGRAGYVQRERLDAQDGCSVIREAGGVPVLAHPWLLEKQAGAKLDGVVAKLSEYGLGGIETYYPSHDYVQTGRYLEIARRFDLVATGGSDFHSPDGGGPKLGTGFGDLRVPETCFDELVERIEQIR